MSVLQATYHLASGKNFSNTAASISSCWARSSLGGLAARNCFAVSCLRLMAFVMSLDTFETWFPFCLDEYWSSETIERSTVEVSESFAFIASLIPDLTFASNNASESSAPLVAASLDENLDQLG